MKLLKLLSLFLLFFFQHLSSMELTQAEADNTEITTWDSLPHEIKSQIFCLIARDDNRKDIKNFLLVDRESNIKNLLLVNRESMGLVYDREFLMTYAQAVKDDERKLIKLYVFAIEQNEAVLARAVFKLLISNDEAGAVFKLLISNKDGEKEVAESDEPHFAFIVRMIRWKPGAALRLFCAAARAGNSKIVRLFLAAPEDYLLNHTGLIVPTEPGRIGMSIAEAFFRSAGIKKAIWRTPDIPECIDFERSIEYMDQLDKKQLPLERAVLEGNLDIVRLLIENGADVNIQNSEGKTAAVIAAECQDYKLADFLLGQNDSLYNVTSGQSFKVAMLKMGHGAANLFEQMKQRTADNHISRWFNA